MNHLQIEKIIGREIMDSRGNPTVEAEVYLCGRRDGKRNCSVAVRLPVNLRRLNFAMATRKDMLEKAFPRRLKISIRRFSETLKGMDASDIYAVDAAMRKADGTKDKSNLGANAILAVSIACAKAAANAFGYSIVPFPWWNQRKPSSGSNDEYCKRRMPCIVFRT